MTYITHAGQTINVPSELVEFHDKFHKVGSRVYVIHQPSVAAADILRDADKIAFLAEKSARSPTLSLDRLIELHYGREVKPRRVLATPAELAEFAKHSLALDHYLDKNAARVLRARLKNAERSVLYAREAVVRNTAEAQKASAALVKFLKAKAERQNAKASAARRTAKSAANFVVKADTKS